MAGEDHHTRDSTIDAPVENMNRNVGSYEALKACDRASDQPPLLSIAQDGDWNLRPAKARHSIVAGYGLQSEDTKTRSTTGNESATTESFADTMTSFDDVCDDNEAVLVEGSSEIDTPDKHPASERCKSNDAAKLLKIEMDQSLERNILESERRSGAEELEDATEDISGGEPRQNLCVLLEDLQSELLPDQAAGYCSVDEQDVDSTRDSYVTCDECSSQEQSESDEDGPLKGHCTPEDLGVSSALAIQVGLFGKIYRWAYGSTVSYAIDAGSFKSRDDEEHATASLDEAAKSWNAKDVGVTFKRVKPSEPHAFDLTYLKRSRASKNALAQGPFPKKTDATQLLYVFKLAFKGKNRKHQHHTFVHELGHALGLRHEFAPVFEPRLPSVLIGQENDLSAMNYFGEHIEKIRIHDLDVKGINELYRLESGKAYKGFQVIDVLPQRIKTCDRHPEMRW